MEPRDVQDTEVYVVGLRLGRSTAGAEQFALWFSRNDMEGNRFVTLGESIAWTTSEEEARSWGAAHLGNGSRVHEEPPALCDIPTLLLACSTPGAAESEFDLLTTIDLLDDFRETADEITAPILDPERALPSRKIHDAVRDALFDGRSWADAVSISGGADAVADAAINMLGRISLASQLGLRAWAESERIPGGA